MARDDPPSSALALFELPEASRSIALDPVLRSAQDYAAEARARRTRIEYAKQWRHFAGWCAQHGLCALPAAPGTVCLYLSARADEGRKVATLAQALAALSQVHQVAGYESPRGHALVRETWKGIRRRHGVAPSQKRALSTSELRALLATLPDDLRGDRDRALLTVGFAGGFRRAELVALELADLHFAREGLECLVRRSKTDQEGHGLRKVIAYGSHPDACPVRALQDWIAHAGLTTGPVFRPIDRYLRVGARALTGHAVAVLLKRAAHRAGLDSAHFAGHSLRAGFVTEAKKHGADDAAIMDQTGHRSLAMLQRYHRRVRAWEQPASARLGL